MLAELVLPLLCDALTQLERQEGGLAQEIGTTSARPRLLTVKEAAAQLRVSTATVYGLCERGRLPYVRVSVHAIRIAEADLSAFIRGWRSSEA